MCFTGFILTNENEEEDENENENEDNRDYYKTTDSCSGKRHPTGCRAEELKRYCCRLGF